jgi:hypothetical protein
MRSSALTVYALLMGLLLTAVTAHAAVELPADNNKEKWNEFVNTFAECSAVYNLAATLKTAPEQGSTSTYRELANGALIAGIMSAEKLGLREDHVESIYTAKFNQWQNVIKDKSKHSQLFDKADQCVSTMLPYQNVIIESLRGQGKAR